MNELLVHTKYAVLQLQFLLIHSDKLFALRCIDRYSFFHFLVSICYILRCSHTASILCFSFSPSAYSYYHFPRYFLCCLRVWSCSATYHCLLSFIFITSSRPLSEIRSFDAVSLTKRPFFSLNFVMFQLPFRHLLIYELLLNFSRDVYLRRSNWG